MKNPDTLGTNPKENADLNEDLEFYRRLRRIVEATSISIVRPLPQTQKDLQEILPEDGALFMEYLRGSLSLDEFCERTTFLHPLCSWLKRNELSPWIVRCVFQLTEPFKKIFEVCPDDRVKAAVERYHEDEDELSSLSLSSIDAELVRRCQSLCQKVLGRAPEYIPFSECRFGPGAVAERLNHAQRWTCSMNMPVLSVFYSDDLYALHRQGILVSKDEVASRMIAVPKTVMKPRLIAAEPSWNSFAQQGLASLMTRRLLRFPALNIHDQDRNGHLCLDQSLATLDQSRASDRIAWSLVKLFLPSDWVELLDAVRTPTVDCLCGERHHLYKFAGMGSATTFPVETLVFAAIACAEISLQTGDDPLDVLNDGRVGFYGDDAIVPVEYAELCLDAYQSCGLVPNIDKSYWTGKFRESCGVYSYEGVEVTPCRRSHWFPSTRTRDDATAMVALIAFVNAIELHFGDALSLREMLSSENIPICDFDIDTSHPKTQLVRAKSGTGWFVFGEPPSGRCLRLLPHYGKYTKCEMGRYLASLHRLDCESSRLDGDLHSLQIQRLREPPVYIRPREQCVPRPLRFTLVNRRDR